MDYAPSLYDEEKKGIDIIRIHMFFQGKEYLEGIGFAPEDSYKVMENVKDVKNNLNLETNEPVIAQWKSFNAINHKRRRIYAKGL